MGAMSLSHILVVVVLLVVLFGRGKISELMGDVAKGIRSFKRGLADEDAPAPPRVAHQPAAAAPAAGDAAPRS